MPSDRISPQALMLSCLQEGLDRMDEEGVTLTVVVDGTQCEGLPPGLAQQDVGVSFHKDSWWNLRRRSDLGFEVEMSFALMRCSLVIPGPAVQSCCLVVGTDAILVTFTDVSDIKGRVRAATDDGGTVH